MEQEVAENVLNVSDSFNMARHTAGCLEEFRALFKQLEFLLVCRPQLPRGRQRRHKVNKSVALFASQIVAPDFSMWIQRIFRLRMEIISQTEFHRTGRQHKIPQV